MSTVVTAIGEGVLVTAAARGTQFAPLLGLAEAFEPGTDLPPGIQQVVILVEPPADAALLDTTEDDVAALLEQLKDVVHQTQAAARHLIDTGVQGGTIGVLLPAYAALGRADASMAGALTDGLMSFYRTIAIELRKDDLALNVVLYDSLQGEDTAAVAALLASYRAAPSITGQETYTGFGPNLGKVKP